MLFFLPTFRYNLFLLVNWVNKQIFMIKIPVRQQKAGKVKSVGRNEKKGQKSNTIV